MINVSKPNYRLMKRYGLFLSIGLLVTIFGCQERPSKAPEEHKKPNIIYILADDMGYGDLGCYGQSVIKTPNLDKLAKNGIRFTDHYAGSTVCAPSRCALMTGKDMGRARIRGNVKGLSLLQNDTTVAEILNKAGYETAIYGKWGLGQFNSPGQPNIKGFDHFTGYLDQIRAHNAYTDWIWKNRDTLKLDNKVEIIPVSYAKGIGSVAIEKHTHTQDVFTSEALQFIEENKDKPFFLYLPYTLPHANNEAWYWNKIGMEVPDLMGYDSLHVRPVEQAYAAAVSYLDRDVGKIVEKIKALGIEDNTLIIFSSDNGPHEEGKFDPKVFKSSGPLRGIKRDLYEGGIRVPMIAYWPGTIKAERVSNHVSAFWDFLPTACDLAGVEAPDWTDGISFYDELIGNKQKKHDHLYWEFYIAGGKQAVRFGKWKGVRTNLAKNLDAPLELYDLSKDIGEKHNIANEHPDIIEKMMKIIAEEHIPSEYFTFTDE